MDEHDASAHRPVGHDSGKPDRARRRAGDDATPTQKAKLSKLSPSRLKAERIAGDKVVSVLDKAPGNGAAIGGIKVVTEHGWFAARPSGTEAIYKIYAESFKDEAHLDSLLQEAQSVMDVALG